MLVKIAIEPHSFKKCFRYGVHDFILQPLAHSLSHVNSTGEVLLRIDQNFSSINDKINTELNIWSSSALLLLGKLFVLRSIIVPKIMLKAAKLPVILPDSCIKNINQVLLKFIWGSKWEKVGWWQLCCNIVDEN